jgi:AraC-like DNA-binding protein
MHPRRDSAPNTRPPRALAAAFGISVRTLHLRFREAGCSFGEWLLEGRLELCGKALADTRQAGHTISEIAFACGFRDLSHFNRSFRARFGVTPGAWRAGIRAI